MLDLSKENCWLNIDKPIGFSSAKCVAIVKKMTKAKKVGHGGTLDPFASGVLPIALSKATKTSQNMMDAPKKYFFRIEFGKFTDSDDVTGNVIEQSEKRSSINEFIFVLSGFVGKISQIPSQFSAIKINGKRAYELARQGIEVEMKAREIEIFSIKLINFCQDYADLEVCCSKGTYIRSLARDICKKLEICGFVKILRRLQVGKFREEKIISLDALKSIITFQTSHLDDSMLFISDVC